MCCLYFYFLKPPACTCLQYVSVLYAEAGSAAGVDGRLGGHCREQRVSAHGGQRLVHHQEAQITSPPLNIQSAQVAQPRHAVGESGYPIAQVQRLGKVKGLGAAHSWVLDGRLGLEVLRELRQLPKLRLGLALRVEVGLGEEVVLLSLWVSLVVG